MCQFLRLRNQNGKGPQQYVSIPFFDGIRMHIVRYVLTVPHPVANVWVGEFHFNSTEKYAATGIYFLGMFQVSPGTLSFGHACPASFYFQIVKTGEAYEAFWEADC
jgi:hypothetical protein